MAGSTAHEIAADYPEQLAIRYFEADKFADADSEI